ncbi:MAG: class I SAM-dependent methyltransferase [Acidobacteria bacterium]|nr:MAG: class I SAM-dependent methyltransferase [Acidobacteriota bacterium]
MSSPEPDRPSRDIEVFFREESPSLEDWRWLWEGNHPFPVQTDKTGLRGRFTLLVKHFVRLIRPLVSPLLGELYVRQLRYNVVLLDHLDEHRARLAHLEAVKREGFDDVSRHTDALFALVDQKLDRYRRESQHLWGRLGGLLAVADTDVQRPAVDVQSLEDVWREQGYLELEDRFRGTREEIAGRMEIYVPYLADRGEVLDLGCGRGESLALLRDRGVPARGIDSSEEMVGECRKQDLEVEQGDLFEVLEHLPEGQLGGVISFHVIEHLPAESIDRLVRLAWRALRPAGVLVLETPNPLSLVVAARNFWLDPTHRRPIHPETLKLTYELAGFDQVEQIDLRPFADEDRLPELALADLPDDVKHLADQVNQLRDKLDRLLYGYQDYAMIGTKPS